MVRSSQDTHVWAARTASKAVAFGAMWYAGVHVGLGVPAFIGLLIVAMFTCGTGEKWSGQASAYSVFNDGERITGTMSAEQLDGQMRNGGHAVQSKKTDFDSSFIQNAMRGWGGGSASASGGHKRCSVDPENDLELRRRRSQVAAAAQARAGGTL